MRGDDCAAAFHERLVWLVRDGGFSQTEVSKRVGRSQASVSEWLTETDWNLPDAEAMLRLPDALSRPEKKVNTEWFLTGQGSPYGVPTAPGALYYRGAQAELAEMELTIKRRRQALQQEENASLNGDVESAHPSSAADRVARTSRALRDAQQPKKHRRSG
jgi:transposase